MYECLEMHDCLRFWQDSFIETDKTWEDWARSGSCHNIYTWKSSLERLTYLNHGWGQYITSHIQNLQKREPWKVLWYRSPLLGVSVLGKHWMFASMVNAFNIIFHSFIFHSFIFQSHFCLNRPFGFSIHREYILFIAPLLPELPS
jgi:hypothetical protein